MCTAYCLPFLIFLCLFFLTSHFLSMLLYILLILFFPYTFSTVLTSFIQCYILLASFLHSLFNPYFFFPSVPLYIPSLLPYIFPFCLSFPAGSGCLYIFIHSSMRPSGSVYSSLLPSLLPCFCLFYLSSCLSSLLPSIHPFSLSCFVFSHLLPCFCLFVPSSI